MYAQRFEAVRGDEHLTSHSGLALVGALLDRSGLEEQCNLVEGKDRKRKRYSLGELCRAMVGLICDGRPDFDAIEVEREQPFFAQALGLPDVPSAPTLRQRLQGAGDTLHAAVRIASSSLVRRCAPRISGVLSARHGELVPVEMDVVVFDNSDSHKEGLGYTYHECMGYAPIFSHVGREGYLVDADLRRGEQHSQDASTPSFLRGTLTTARRIVADGRSLLLRTDSGFDSRENLIECEASGVYYLAARNRRRETLEEWLAIAQAHGVPLQPREGKTVWYGEIFREVDGQQRRIVFEVTQRTTKWNGTGYQTLLIPEIDIETFWTNLLDSPMDCIDLYHDRGTSEQFHSEIKTDLGLERLPSGSFTTNELILLLGMLSYNIMRLIGQEALRSDATMDPNEVAPIRKFIMRRRVGSVMLDLIHLAARVVSHGRRLILAFGQHAPWAGVWQRVYRRFASPVASG